MMASMSPSIRRCCSMRPWSCLSPLAMTKRDCGGLSSEMPRVSMASDVPGLWPPVKALKDHIFIPHEIPYQGASSGHNLGDVFPKHRGDRQGRWPQTRHHNDNSGIEAQPHEAHQRKDPHFKA